LFLLSRRTVTLGALLSAAAMTNVLVLNVAYDVGVKMLAGEMCLMSMVLLLPNLTRLYELFILGRATRLVPAPAVFPDARRQAMPRILSLASAIAIVFWTYAGARQVVDFKVGAMRSPLYGAWVVEVSENDITAPLPANDDRRWRRLIFDDDGAFALTMADAEIRYRMRVDSTARTIQLLAPPPAPPGDSAVASYEFRFEGDQHLELRSRGQGDGLPTVIRLRRIDSRAWPLVAHTHLWYW
jgi:hypothetical protein